MSAVDEITCGRIGARWPILTIAERAAQAVAGAGAGVPRAVCLDPDGYVTVEDPDQALPDDLVAVLVWVPGHVTQMDLWKQIEAELRTAARARGIALRRAA